MKTHFSITPSDEGTTYQLYQWGFLYDIGLALGYTYFHTGFEAHRSNLLDVKSGIYDFLGITRHFQSENTADGFEEYIKIHISESFIWRRELWDIAVLMTHIKEQVTQQARQNKKTLIQLIILDHKKKLPQKQIKKPFGKRFLLSLYYIIKLAIKKHLKTNHTPWRYGPDLYPIYLKQRKIQPWLSRFPPGKTKVTVHIRRGDTVSVDTPWGEKIEYRSQELKSRHIKTSNFKQFVQQLNSRFSQHGFSTLFFSDGHERLLQHLREEKGKYNLSNEQIEILSRQITIDSESEFKPLEEVENSRAIIGEAPEKLFDFIHSCLTADIIITAAHYKLIRKLGSLYFDKLRSPIIIFLHQGNFDVKKFPPAPPVPTDKSIFFNVRAPDYAALERHLKKFLPQ